MTSEQQRDRESVWAQVATQRPEFTHRHDPTNNWHAVREIVLGSSLAWIGANERFAAHPGARVMDIGANVGLFSASCALRGASVTAYEADPETFGILSGMIADTNLPIRAEHKAVWVSDGEISFYGFGDVTEGRLQRNGCLNVNANGFPEVPGSEKPKTVKECVSTIETISFSNAIGNAEWDCVKFDIEGGEFEILANASVETLSKIKFCFVEVHPWADDALYNRMISNVEKVFRIEGGKDPRNRWEYLFLSRK